MAFDALFNVRDLGGHACGDGRATRHGVLFRADGVHRATPSDRRRLVEAGVRAVVDLRTAGERTEEGVAPADESLSVHHAPILERVWGRDERPSWVVEGVDGPGMLAALYRWLLTDRSDALGSTVSLLARLGVPTVLHCTAGKDRTGLVAALVLDCCGVSDHVIATDYAASAAAMPALAGWYRTNRPDATVRVGDRERGSGGGDPESARAMALVAAEPATMHETLEFLRDRWGSAREYLVASGVASSQLDALVDRLTTDT